MYVMVRHKVGDYAKWKSVFDSDQETIAEAGFKKYGLYRTAKDDKDLIVFLEISDESKVREFFNSDFAKNRMKEATVVGEPEIVFLDMIDKKLFGATEKAA